MKNTKVNEKFSLIQSAIENNKALQVALNIDPSVVDGYIGDVPLIMFAASFGNPIIVQMLINHKADVNLKDDSGNTALMTAIEEGHREVVKILLSANADVNATNEHGESALSISVSKLDIEFTKLLVDNGVSVAGSQEEGTSVFDIINSSIEKAIQSSNKGAQSKADTIKDILAKASETTQE